MILECPVDVIGVVESKDEVGDFGNATNICFQVANHATTVLNNDDTDGPSDCN